MKLEAIKITEIEVPEVRVTARFDPELWEQFQASMRVEGQITPIIVYRVDDKLILCDGLHRLIEAETYGSEYINAVVIPGDMIDVLTRNIFLDHLRGKTPVSEMVTVIGSLWKEFGLDSEKIAERTGLTRDYVEKLQKISELTPLCQEALDEGRIKVGHASALAKIPDPVRQESVLYQQLLYNWTVKDLEEHIKEVERLAGEIPPPPEDTPPAPRAKIKCQFCREDHEIAEIANPNTCVGCAGMMYEAISLAKAERERRDLLPHD